MAGRKNGLIDGRGAAGGMDGWTEVRVDDLQIDGFMTWLSTRMEGHPSHHVAVQYTVSHLTWNLLRQLAAS
jgi:hypothetical protein